MTTEGGVDTRVYPGVKIEFRGIRLYVDTYRTGPENIALAQAAIRAMFGDDVFEPLERGAPESMFTKLGGSMEFYRLQGAGL